MYPSRDCSNNNRMDFSNNTIGLSKCSMKKLKITESIDGFGYRIQSSYKNTFKKPNRHNFWL